MAILQIYFHLLLFFYYRPCDGNLTPTSKKQPPMTSAQQLFFNKNYIKLDLIKYKKNSKNSYVDISYFHGYFISALENSKNKNKFVRRIHHNILVQTKISIFTVRNSNLSFVQTPPILFLLHFCTV